MDYVLTKPCQKCGAPAGTVGTATATGPQLVARCICGQYIKCVPKTESGLKPRSVQTTHEAIKPKQRQRILQRANAHCELCGATQYLNVGHLISVKDGLERGMTETQLNDDENLCAMCEQCNLGLGPETVPLRFAVNLLMARLKAGKDDGSQSRRCPFDAQGEGPMDSVA